MPEQGPEYHPEVEKILVTEGPDIGRVKDETLAHELANSQEDRRGIYPNNLEYVDWQVDDLVEQRIAENILNRSHLAYTLILNGIDPTESKHIPSDAHVAKLYRNVVEQIRAAVQDNRKLKESAIEQKDKALLTQELAAARQRVAELEAQLQPDTPTSPEAT